MPNFIEDYKLYPFCKTLPSEDDSDLDEPPADDSEGYEDEGYEDIEEEEEEEEDIMVYDLQERQQDPDEYLDPDENDD